jgi:hypothetical protein
MGSPKVVVDVPLTALFVPAQFYRRAVVELQHVLDEALWPNDLQLNDLKRLTR